jgi:hypothetical protein
MNSKVIRFGFSTLLTLACAAAFAWSGDSTVNNPVCTATGQPANPQIVSDGSGGAIIAWEDTRDGGSIYAQRLDSGGAPQWTANGVKICDATDVQNSIRMVSDGSGGAIISWVDYRADGANADIYAQRINSGTVQWATNGLPVCTAAGVQDQTQIVRDGSTGAIISWRDTRNGNQDIYVQRIDINGIQQWAADGIAVCTAANSQNEQQLTTDGSGGAIITWRDERDPGPTDIYAQRVSAVGAAQWTANGDAVSTQGATQKEPTITSDGAGGAIIAWIDQRNSNEDIYAQRISSSGAQQWTLNGVAACAHTSGQAGVRIASGASNDAILTWYDDRPGIGVHDIYAQRLNSSGATQWTADGVAICTATDRQNDPLIISDGTGGAIISWLDVRANGFDYDIYAQKINSAGAVQWATNGLAVCTYDNYEEQLAMTTDNAGGAILTWRDGRGDGEVYASRATAAGSLPVSLSRLFID